MGNKGRVRIEWNMHWYHFSTSSFFFYFSFVFLTFLTIMVAVVKSSREDYLFDTYSRCDVKEGCFFFSIVLMSYAIFRRWFGLKDTFKISCRKPTLAFFFFWNLYAWKIMFWNHLFYGEMLLRLLLQYRVFGLNGVG